MPALETPQTDTQVDRVRFLLDEYLSPELVSGVLRRNPEIDSIAVGGSYAPRKGTKDPEVLLFCEQERRALVPNNRKSMPGHLATFAAQGHHHWGIFQIHATAAIGDLIEELLLIWGATDPGEHIDIVRWIPE